MTITYDKTAKAMYIQLRNSEVFRTKVVFDGFHIDFDASGKIKGIELLSIMPIFHIFKSKKLSTSKTQRLR